MLVIVLFSATILVNLPVYAQLLPPTTACPPHTNCWFGGVLVNNTSGNHTIVFNQFSNSTSILVPPVQQNYPPEDWACTVFQNNTTDCIGTTPPTDGRFTPNQTNPEWTCELTNGVTHCHGTYPSMPITSNDTQIPVTSPTLPQPIPTVIVTITSGSGGSQSCVQSDNCYNPSTLNVKLGTQVEWRNEDTVSHTVTSGHQTDSQTGTVFDSSIIKSGGSYDFTFNTLGTYDYFCMVHPWMTGSIIVSETAPVQQNSTSFQEPNTGPDWIKHIFNWYDEGKISQQDMLSFVKWLIENKIMGR